MNYFFISYLLLVKKKSAVFIFLLINVIVTLIFGGIIGKVPIINDLYDIFVMLFSSFILTLLIHGFKNYRNLNVIVPYKNPRSFKILVKILTVLGIFVTLLNLYITYKAFGALISETITVQSYKNEGEASDVLVKWVGAGPLFISRFLSPLGYFALGLHFYFLVKKRITKSFIFLLISFNIPLLGFHGLSRAAASQYILIYIAYFLYTFKALTPRVRKNMFAFGFLMLISGFFLLNIITESRFNKYYNIPSASKIQDPVLYSTLDYLSQWNINGFEVIKDYSIDKNMSGRSTFPIFPFVGERLGMEFEPLSELRYKSLGKKYSAFNGVVATLLYDFGYFFTFIFALFFFKIVVKRSPRNGVVNLSDFVFFGVLIPLPLMFFMNNAYTYVSLNLAIIYLLFINLIMKTKK